MGYSFLTSRFALPTVVFALGAVACGGDGDSSGSEANETPDAAAGTGGGPGGPPAVPGPTLPVPTGACPEFVDGTAAFTADARARQVRLWVDAAAAAEKDGPIVFYWYGTGGNPEQAVAGLGLEGIQRITAAGGVVAAPVHVTTGAGVLPWLSGGPEDLALAEEVIGCASQKVGIDGARIHTLGFSAGALFSGRLGVERSGLFASVASYSGGGGGTLQDPNNKYAAMLLHGGPGDVVIIPFQTATQDYHRLLTDAGHFAFICDHGGGHRIPGDAVPNVVQFFFDHPYGTVPSPYAGGLPPGFPSYCTL